MTASFSLAYLLDIDFEKTKDSKSLGNSSSSLSFNQKINLLLDNKSITKEEKLKLEAFMNIRNQFMHNKDADSYLNAISHISGLQNRLKKYYPDFFQASDLEKNLENCVTELYNDSLRILREYKGGREKKMTAEVERIVYTKRFKSLEKTMKSELDRVNDFVKNHESELIKKKDLIPLIGLLKYEIILKMQEEYEKKE
jgi:hypothetical protein